MHSVFIKNFLMQYPHYDDYYDKKKDQSLMSKIVSKYFLRFQNRIDYIFGFFIVQYTMRYC
jgi:hypothetical protein